MGARHLVEPWGPAGGHSGPHCALREPVVPRAPHSIAKASTARLGVPSHGLAGGSQWWVAHWASEFRFQPQSESWVISAQRGRGHRACGLSALLQLAAPGLCCGHEEEWAGHGLQWGCGLRWVVSRPSAWEGVPMGSVSSQWGEGEVLRAAGGRDCVSWSASGSKFRTSDRRGGNKYG